MAEETCSHLNAITKVKHPTRREWEECVKIGANWVHLRACQTCGVTLCCDDSPNRHAREDSWMNITTELTPLPVAARPLTKHTDA